MSRRNIVSQIFTALAPSELTDCYEIELACAACCTKGGNANCPYHENCHQNIVIAKKPNRDYSIVRPIVNVKHQGKFIACLDFRKTNSCPRANCAFAHGVTEEDFWNSRFDINYLLEQIKDALISANLMNVNFFQANSFNNNNNNVSGGGLTSSSSGGNFTQFNPRNYQQQLQQQSSSSSNNKSRMLPNKPIVPPKPMEQFKNPSPMNPPMFQNFFNNPPPPLPPSFHNPTAAVLASSSSSSSLLTTTTTTPLFSTPIFANAALDPFPLPDFDIQMRCYKCVTLINQGRNGIAKINLNPRRRHLCLHSMLLVRKTFDHSGDWDIIRPRPCRSVSHDYKECTNLSNGCKNSLHCPQPHSAVETSLWNFDRGKHFSILKYWFSHRRALPSVREQVKCLGLPYSHQIVFCTVCEDCYNISPNDLLISFQLYEEGECEYGHKWKPFLLLLEPHNNKDWPICKNEKLIRLHKGVIPSSAGRIQALPIRPAPISNDNMTFCSYSFKCTRRQQCQLSHSDRELQMWHFEKDLQRRFGMISPSEVSKWLNYIPQLSVQKLHKIIAGGEVSQSLSRSSSIESNLSQDVSVKNLPSNQRKASASNYVNKPPIVARQESENENIPASIINQDTKRGGGAAARGGRRGGGGGTGGGSSTANRGGTGGGGGPSIANRGGRGGGGGPSSANRGGGGTGTGGSTTANNRGGRGGGAGGGNNSSANPRGAAAGRGGRNRGRGGVNVDGGGSGNQRNDATTTTPCKNEKSSSAITSLFSPPIVLRNLWESAKPSDQQSKRSSPVEETLNENNKKVEKKVKLFCSTCGHVIMNVNEWKKHMKSILHANALLIATSGYWPHRPVMSTDAQDICPVVHGKNCKFLAGFCTLPASNEEKVEWQIRQYCGQLLEQCNKNANLTKEINSNLNKLLTLGFSESDLNETPSHSECYIGLSGPDVDLVLPQAKQQQTWTVTFIPKLSDKPVPTKAVLLLPAFYPYFRLKCGDSEPTHLPFIEFDLHRHTVLDLSFVTPTPGYYEQWLMVYNKNWNYLRRFSIHVEIPNKVEDSVEQCRRNRVTVSDSLLNWSKVTMFSPETNNRQRHSDFVFPLSKPNEVTFTSNPYGTDTFCSSPLLQRMHQLLQMEEDYQCKLLIDFCAELKDVLQNNGANLLTNINITDLWICPPQSGQLFVKLDLPEGVDLLQEHHDPRVYLLKNSIQMVWIACKKLQTNGDDDNELLYFECPLISKNSAFINEDPVSLSPRHIFFILSKECVQTLGLSCNKESVWHGIKDIYMRPGYGATNASLFYNMHLAVANQPISSNGRPFIDPDITVLEQFPGVKSKIAKSTDNEELNVDQSMTLESLTHNFTETFHLKLPPPPFVLRGCFGSGKTRTLGALIRLCLSKQSATRILVCTHTNTAADIYVTRELHPYLKGANDEADTRIVRIFSQSRKTFTQPTIINKYALFEENVTPKRYRRGTLNDLTNRNYRVVVSTLSTLGEIICGNDLNSCKMFDYILIDEAAQILEAEALIAVTLASVDQTRVVFAGDDMQQRPIIFSPIAREAGLALTALDRLWHHYDETKCDQRSHLHIVYRSHAILVRFLSESFYGGAEMLQCDAKANLVNCPPDNVPGMVMCHVYAGDGESQCRSSVASGLWNIPEADALVARVEQLLSTKVMNIEEEDICVVSSFHAQIYRIRNLLRRKRFRNVEVTHINNIQGREFRVVLISTVLTRQQKTSEFDDEKEDIQVNVGDGWQGNDLCHEKSLINTAMSRAISILEVFGDTVGLALSPSDDCAKVWESYIRYCHQTNDAALLTVDWLGDVQSVTNNEQDWQEKQISVKNFVDFPLQEWQDQLENFKNEYYIE